MFHKFYPDDWIESSYYINYVKLYQDGYRGVLFDIDNTLVEHGADADDRVKKLIKELKQIGFKICLISNNKEVRVKRFNQEIQAPYIYKAGKPSKKNYIKAMELIGTNSNNSIFVGDQLFTDILGAKRAKIYSILVKPIGKKEEIQIVLKRYLEHIVLFFYKRRKIGLKK